MDRWPGRVCDGSVSVLPKKTSLGCFEMSFRYADFNCLVINVRVNFDDFCF
jgi:hypothetical protein